MQFLTDATSWLKRQEPHRLGARRLSALLLVGVLALSACGGGDGPEGATSPQTDETGQQGETAGGEPYRLGFAGTVTGPPATAGVPQRAGWLTYIEHVNAEGGVNGRQIEVRTLDDAADPAVGISNYEELARDFGALGVFGFTSSGVWSAAGEIAEEQGVAQLAISGVDDWTTEYHPYLFKVGMSQRTAANIQLDFVESLMTDEGIENPQIALLRLTTVSGEVFEGAITELLGERGWEVIEAQSVDHGAADCTSQAAAIVDSEPDVVLSNLVNSGEDVVCAQAILQRGFEGSIVNNFQSPSQTTIERIASDQFYSQRVFIWAFDESVPDAVTMVERAEKYGYGDDVDAFFADGYVAGMLMVEALKKCGDDCTPETYRDALESISQFETGLSGPNTGFAEGPFGHESNPEGLMVKWDPDAQEAVTVSDWVCGIPTRC